MPVSSLPGPGELLAALRSFPPRIQAAIALALVGAIVVPMLVGILIRRRGGAKSIFAQLVGKLLGRPEQYSYVLFSILIVVCFTGIAVSGWAFARFANEAEMGSGRIAEVVLGIATNFTVWAVLTVVAVLVVFHRLTASLADETAAETRFTKGEIEHIAAECKSTDGTSRLIGGPNHSEDQLRAKLLRVFNGEDLDEGVEALDELAPDSKLDDSETEHGGALPEPAGQLPAPGEEGAPALADSEADSEAATDEEGAAPETRLAELEVLDGALTAELLASQIDYQPARDGSDAHRGGTLDDVPREEISEPAVSPDERDGTDAGEADTGGIDAMGMVQRKLQLAKMDVAAAASGDEIFARFVTPALLTGLACFTIAGTLWVHPLLYPVVACISVLVGSIVYTGFKWKRRKNVVKARETSDLGGWYACDALAKASTTERGTEFYVVWMAGHRYFGFDKHRVARKAANRWHQRLNGEIVAPAIHEHFWKSARSMMPLTYHIEYKDDRRGRGAIYDTIADVIREQEDSIVPKKHLCELVVDRGPEYGFDPDIVAEVYEDMVGEALEEFEVKLRNTDGELEPVTLVTLRTAGVPLDMETLRSEFSNQVSPEDEPLYGLPEVEKAFDIEDALTVGVPPGVDPAEWDPSKERTDISNDAGLDAQPAAD